MSSPTEPTLPTDSVAPGTEDAVTRAIDASAGMAAVRSGEASAPNTAAAPSIDEVRNTLWLSKWGQGSILPDALAAQVQRIPFAPPAQADEIAVVITQDCDAIHGDCAAEPALEVALVRPIATPSANFKTLKNPRTLHVELVGLDGTLRAVEVSAWRRGFIERRQVVAHQPRVDWRVPPGSLDLIVSLFSRRYDRVAFPEAFVERFRPVAAKLDKIVTRLATEITGVFLRVDPEADYPLDEDPESHPYDVRIYLLMSDALCRDLKRQSQIDHEVRKDLLAVVRDQPGLVPRGVTFVDPVKISLGEWMDLTEWDHEPLRAGLATKTSGKAMGAPTIGAAPMAIREPASEADQPGTPPPGPLD
jgi:hypothetical protein